jgi:tetratricopeptide (TPR) repeat protein
MIVDRADGVPMFAEELTKTMLGSDYLVKQDGHYELSGALPPVAVPVSLQDSLMARLDRLGPHKEVAQIGAMLGRTFRYDVLAAVSKLDDNALRQSLAALVKEELLLQRGLPPDATYAFRQGLIQEVAYQSLLISQRQTFHRDIAEVLEARFPDIADAEPEEISRHYAAAGVKDRAVVFCRRAADLSIAKSAMTEALVHLDGALELLAVLPATPENRRQTAEIQVMRGAALSATRGFFAPEVGEAFEHARQLSGTEDDDHGVLHARAWLGLFAHNVTRDRLDKAREISAKLLDLAHKLQREDILFSAYISAGISALDLGEVVLARDYLDNALARVAEIRPDQASWMAVQDPGVVAWSMSARTRFMLGYPEQAAEGTRQAVARAESKNHDVTLVFALAFTGSLYALLRDWEKLEATSSRCAEIASEHDFTHWKIFSAIYHGLALAKLGRTRDGLAEAERAVELGQQWWQNGPTTFFLVALAELYLEAGLHDKALEAVDQGLARMVNFGGRSYEAELYRLRGAILRDRALTSGEEEAAALSAEAAAALEQAIAVAKAQSTLSWHLRAVLELVRLREDEGGGGEERTQIRALYDQFTEGFDTPDLVEARAMLEAVHA